MFKTKSNRVEKYFIFQNIFQLNLQYFFISLKHYAIWNVHAYQGHEK